MKKIYVLTIAILFASLTAFAQFSFPAAGPVSVTSGAPFETLNINNAGNSAGVPANQYSTFTITLDWNAVSGNPWSNEAVIIIRTNNTNLTLTPANGGASNGNSTTLIFTGIIPGGLYDPNTSASIRLRFDQELDGSTASYSNIVVTINPLVPEPPANDNFANATPISCGNIYTGDSTLATIDEVGAPDTSTIEPDTSADNDSPNVWFSFIGTGDPVTLSTCGTANTNFDTEILVFTGNSGNLTLIDDAYDECGGAAENYAAETTFTSVLGIAYYISVEGWNVGDTGIFQLSVICTPPAPVTYTYTNGSWDTDPNGISTSNDDILIVSGEATINTNTICDVLTINPGASLTVGPEAVILQLSGSLDMKSISNQYSSLILNGTILGTINYKRHVNTFATNATTGNNDLVAPPVTNASQTFGVFRTNPDNANIPSGTIGGVPSFLFGPFNRDTNAYVNYTAGNDGDPLQAGIGYRTASTAPGGSTLSFTGDVLTGTVPVSISIGTLSEWNLIGNPYTSYINSGDFLTANAAFLDEDAIGIYGYDGSAQNGWTIINFNTMNTANNITPGQGFLIAAQGSATLNFTPVMRRNTGSDDFILGRSSMDTNHYLKLNVNNASSNFHTDFYFNDNSSRDLDPGYDAKLFNATLPSLYMYSHLVDNNEGVSMAIQSLATTDLTDVIVPLGINANQGEQLTVSVAESTLPVGIEVYLEDTLTNAFTLLNTSEYVLTPSNNISGTGRFFLRFSAEALSTSEDNFETIQIYTTTSPKTLFIKGALQNGTKLEIYDIQGRMILKSKLNTRSHSNDIDISGLTTGVYVVKLNNGISQKSQKVIIN